MDIVIPDREDSWGRPIYVKPRQYMRNRQNWKHDHEADVFFRARGDWEKGDIRQRLTIEVNYDIEAAKANTAFRGNVDLP